MAKSTLYGEIMGEGNWTPIVDEPTWRAMDRFLADRERPDSTVGKLANLLSRIATCTVCGGPVGASKRGDAPIYVCQGPEDETSWALQRSATSWPGSGSPLPRPAGVRPPG